AVSLLAIFLGEKRAAQQRGTTQHRKQTGGSMHSRYFHNLIAQDELEVAAVPAGADGHFGKHRILSAPVQVVWATDALLLNPALCSSLPQSHQSIRLRVGQRLEQYFIDDAKDRRVRSDAEREREHGHGGEAGILQQLAKGEFEIIHNAAPP